jgi:hypothetical protein
MTLPLSGPLEASDINVELGRSATATFSITDAATGVYGAINTCSPYYPNGSAPHTYSEWYGYNHNAICLNSYYAFSPVDSGFITNFLRSDKLNYATIVSSNKPDPTAQFTLSMWIKIDDNIINAIQGYVTSLHKYTVGGDQVLFRLDWYSLFNSGTGAYNNSFFFSTGNGTYPGFDSSVDVSDVNNTSITGVSDGGTLSQAGYLDANGYFLLTIVVDYSNFGTADYVKYYWNDALLTSQYSTPLGTPVTPNYAGFNLNIGAIHEFELSSGCLIDGYALFIDTALSSSDVTTIYNGGAVATLSKYTSISSRVLFYNFESDNPNLGNETGGNYNFDLDEINSPQRVQPPAA